MTNRLEFIGDLLNKYARTKAHGVTVIGQGDYGIEAHFTNGARQLCVLGLDKAADAQDLATILARALPIPKAPQPMSPADGSPSRRQREVNTPLGRFLMEAEIEDDVPEIVGFTGYHVVAVLRSFAPVEDLPKLGA